MMNVHVAGNIIKEVLTFKGCTGSYTLFTHVNLSFKGLNVSNWALVCTLWAVAI